MSKMEQIAEKFREADAMISSIGMNREMNRLFSVFANRVQENASRAEADKASQNVIKGISWGNNNIDQLYPDSASRLEAVASGKVENPRLFVRHTRMCRPNRPPPKATVRPDAAPSPV